MKKNWMIVIKNKTSSISKSIKASLGLFFATLVTRGISYITTPIYTRMLSTDEYGQISVYQTWSHLFGLVAMFCLSYGVYNNGMLDYPDKRDDYALSMLGLSNFITGFTGLALLLLYPIYQQIIKIRFEFVVLMIVMFIFQPAYNFWTARQRYELKYKASMLWTILCSVISPLVAITAIQVYKEHHVEARLFGGEGALICIYILFYIHLFVKGKGKINTKYWKNAFLFNLPLIPHYLSTYMLNSSDKLMISALVSDTATAFYSVAYAIAAVASTVWSAVNASLIPYTYDKLKQHDYKSINRVVSPIILSFVVFSLGVILFAPEILKVLAPKEYSEGLSLIPPIVGGTFFQIQYYIYANVVYYYKRPKYVMFASLSSMLANIVMNYIFINIYGYQAAAYTTLVCYLIQAILDYFAMKKVVGETIYNMKYIAVLSLIVIGISFLGVTLYKYSIIRYCIALILVLFCFKNRERIIRIFKMIKDK